MTITLKEAVLGSDKEIELMHAEACKTCNGSGSETKKTKKCPRCGGTGQVRQQSQTPFGNFIRQTSCDQCKGRGNIPEKPCSACHGSGHERVQRTVSVHIPAGVESGMRLRMEGYGEAGDYGAPNGDLYIEIHVTGDKNFTRVGDNLETVTHISPAQAVLGTRVEIMTINGKKLELQVPAGIQSGKKLRVAGEGVRRRGRHGDLLVRVDIIIPKSISSEMKTLYEQILVLEGHNPSDSKQKKGFFDKIVDDIIGDKE